MDLDVRLPIGSMFTIVGVLLMIYGLTSNPVIYTRSLGININLWWGLVLVLFGLALLWLVWRAKKAGEDPIHLSEDSTK